MTNEVQVPMTMGARGIAPANVAELNTLAEMMCKGGVFRGTVMECVCAIGMGAELGLSPFQAVQVIKPINGKYSVFGDGILALLHASGRLANIEETIAGDGDDRTATCKMWRVGVPSPFTINFSVRDAKRALLWGKQGPWTQYPDRMQQFRARGFAARDGFADILRGIISAEEAQDYPRPTVAVSKPLPNSVPDDDNETHVRAHIEARRAVEPPLEPFEETVNRVMETVAGKVVEEKTRADHLKLLGSMLKDMFPGNKEAMAAYLEECSSFDGADGARCYGFDTLKESGLKKVSDRWVSITYHKVKDAWLDWQKGQAKDGSVESSAT